MVLWSAGVVAAGGSDWHLGYYTPSPHGALSFASTDMPASGVATFNFTSLPNTALLVTDHRGSTLLGDLTGKSVSATFEIAGAGQFIYFGEPSCGTNTSAVRLFFQTSNAGGFDKTHHRWSNPGHYDLTNTNGAVIITDSLACPSHWSDFFGHYGNDPLCAAGFAAAAANVTSIGLSFGGGCFFENGVGTVDGSGTFTLDRFTVG